MINLNFGAGNAARSYNIHVTQYDCVDMTALENTAGPKGCLQYHLGDAAGAGRIDNFGYVGANFPAAIGATVTHLQNQNYNICIRRHAAMTRICYEVAVAGTAMMADQGSFGLSTNGDAAAKSGVDATCTADYISIPNAVAMGEAALTNAGFKFGASETIMNGGDASNDEGTILPTGHVGFHL